jgi:hypothetical protein
MADYSVLNCIDPWQKALAAFKSKRKVYKKAFD